MRTFLGLAFFAAVVVCTGDAPRAEGGAAARDATGLIPPYVEAFDVVPRAGLTRFGASLSSTTSGTERVTLAAPPSGGTTSRRNFRLLPVVYSILVPGAGEIYMGYWKRGAALAATEVAAWTGYVVYNNRGLDGRAEFEAFADAHWDFSRWIIEHPATEAMGGDPTQVTFDELDTYGRTVWTGWPGYHPFAAKDDVKLNYYENIGKYDWFISGWDDWDLATKPRDTANRNQYRALRRQSNSDLDTADRFVYLSIVARVYSIVETVILARQEPPDPHSAVDTKSYSVTARSTGRSSGQVVFEYHFH